MTGRIERATFVTAQLSNGRTNTLSIVKLGFTDMGNVQFEVSSAAWPPGTGTSYMRMPDITDEDRVDGSFKVLYEMRPDLSEIVSATLTTD